MPLHLNLASIFGPVLVIIGVWNLLYKENVKKMTDSLKKTPAALFIGGLINLIVGLTIINLSPPWVFHLPVLVPLLGWLCLLRGLMFLFMPNLFFELIKGQSGMTLFFGLISVAWGLALCYLAFMH